MAGKIATLRAKGFTGSLTAASIGTMVVTGNLSADVTVTGAGVAAGKPAVTGLTVTGEVKLADISVTGNVSAVTVGAFRDSRLYVNYDPGTSKFGAAATVGSFRVTGPVDGFQDSDVFAPTLKVVSLKSVNDSNDELFGFTARAIGSLRVLTGSLFKYDPNGPDEQGPPQSKFRVKRRLTRDVSQARGGLQPSESNNSWIDAVRWPWMALLVHQNQRYSII